MITKTIKCIICPKGCEIQVKLDGDQVVEVSSNECSRGKDYSIDECLHPMRMVASTVKCTGSSMPVAAVRTQHSIPKEKVFECMEEIKKACIHAPFEIGDVVIHNVAGTTVDVIVTRNS